MNINLGFALLHNLFIQLCPSPTKSIFGCWASDSELSYYLLWHTPSSSESSDMLQHLGSIRFLYFQYLAAYGCINVTLKLLLMAIFVFNSVIFLCNEVLEASHKLFLWPKVFIATMWKKKKNQISLLLCPSAVAMKHCREI